MAVKKYTKKRDARAKLLRNKPIAFLTFSLPSPSSLLKLPLTEIKGEDMIAGKTHMTE